MWYQSGAWCLLGRFGTTVNRKCICFITKPVVGFVPPVYYIVYCCLCFFSRFFPFFCTSCINFPPRLSCRGNGSEKFYYNPLSTPSIVYGGNNEFSWLTRHVLLRQTSGSCALDEKNTDLSSLRGIFFCVLNPIRMIKI